MTLRLIGEGDDIPRVAKPPVNSVAAKLRLLADKAEKDPEKYKYAIAMVASSDFVDTEWYLYGKPTLMISMGLMEVTKDEIYSLFASAEKDPV